MRGYFCQYFPVSYIFCAPNNVQRAELSLWVLTLQHFHSVCGCFSSPSVMAICERVAVTNKAITLRFTRDRRSLTLVFSVRCSWVVFWWEAGDCDPQVSCYERLDLYSDTDCQCLRCHAGIHVFQRESGEWNEMKTAGRGEECPEVVVTELLHGCNFGGPTWDFLHSISAV